MATKLLILLFPCLLFAQWDWSGFGASANTLIVPTVILDTLGTTQITDTTDFHGETFDSVFVDGGTTVAFGDSIYWGTDTSVANIINFDHNQTDNTNYYVRVRIKVTATGLTQTVIKSINIPDMWAPLAGTIDTSIYELPYNDSLEITNSLSPDVTDQAIWAKSEAEENYIVYNWNSLITGINFSFTDLLSYVSEDCLIVRSAWADEADNTSPYAYDTLWADVSPNLYFYKALYDSSHGVLDSIRFIFSTDGDSTNPIASFVVAADDSNLTQTDDTLAYGINRKWFETYNPLYIHSQIRGNTGWFPDTSRGAVYP